MSKNYMNDSQASEIIKYISDTMKIPVLGAGGGFAPIGTEAYFDGQVAPLGWVICDGTELNIADYPDLATYYASQHGASNYYGGDGTTTFATPKRSGMPNNEDSVYGDNERIIGVWRETVDGVLKEKPVYEKTLVFNYTGSNVPYDFSDTERIIDYNFIAQDSDSRTLTWHNNTWGSYTQGACAGAMTGNNGSYWWIWFSDSGYWSNAKMSITWKYTKTTDTWQLPQYGHSADGNGVFCVKATVSGDANAHQYSTEEQIVGTWIDGSDIYEKTINCGAMPNNTAKNVTIPSGISRIVEGHGYFYNPSSKITAILPYGAYNSNSGDAPVNVYFDLTNDKMVLRSNNNMSTFTEGYFTIQYTKTQS